MPTRITAANIAPGSITADRLAEGAGGGPRITNIEVTDDAYTVIDDTAVSPSGGYVKITGTGFQTGCVAIIGTTTATATAFVSSNFINVQVPALAAGTYIVYVVNPDGAVAIRVNGLTYSATPTWITGSTLSEIGLDDQISIQLSASSNSTVTYGLQAGSTLPPGLSLSAQGLLTGSVTGLEDDTVYSFTVVAQDAENQDSPRTFSITVGIGDPYFYLTTLLLNGDGTNGANNNMFVDSSTNNFAITRNGNVAQGTFSPFSAPNGRWSAYFDGTGDYLTIPNNLAFNLGTGDFTFECWAMFEELSTSSATGDSFFSGNGNSSVDFSYIQNSLRIGRYGVAWDNTFAFTPNLYQWYHIAYTRSSGTLRVFVNGSLIGSDTNTISYTVNGTALIGSDGDITYRLMKGYISNLRLVKGTAVYTSNFTPPTSPLTAITNTSLLACQSNRFKDNSTNNFTITRNGDVKVTPFSPFAPTGSSNGGSGYFDGSGDNIITGASNFSTSNFTLEFWLYPTIFASVTYPVYSTLNGAKADQLAFELNTNGTLFVYISGTSVWNIVSGGNMGTITLNSWNHVALVREGNAFKSYINGSQGPLNVSSSLSIGSLNGFSVGSYVNAGFYTGYISNLRQVVGTAVYTAAFTPPTSPLTAVTNTSLLCNFTNGGIIDYTGKNNLETVGNAQISTSVKKYGTGSMYFDGSGDWLTSPANQDLSFGTGNFTVEGWFNTSSLSGQPALIGVGGDAGGLVITFYSSKIYAYFVNAGDVFGSGGATLSTGTWYHFAWVRSGSTHTFYLNGTAYGSTYSSSANHVNGGLGIGKTVLGTTFTAFTGFIDDLRITKGFARYTSNFTPPASAHRLR